MKIKDLVRDELIGLYIEVIKSKNKSNEGIKGKIIDETRNTIVVEQENNKKRLFKNNININVYIEDKIIPIDGRNLIGRPKERIKIRRIR